MFQNERGVVVQVAVVFAAGPVVHQDQLVAGAAQKMSVMTYQEERPFKLRKRQRECFARRHVEVVCRFVEHQKIGFVPGNERQRQPRLFAAREAVDLGVGKVARESEFAEPIAKFLLPHGGGLVFEDFDGGTREIKLLQLVLREVPDDEPLAAPQGAGHRRQRVGNRLDERRLAGAVHPQDAHAVARADREHHVV